MRPARARWLLERAAETGCLEDLLNRASAGAGGLVVIAGSAGIGKTRLLESARAAAEERGIAVVTASAGELEREFPFALVRQLLAPALGAPGDPLFDKVTAGAAELAAPLLAQGLRPAVAAPPEALLHGLYWLVSNLAEEGPLLLAVDDAHWGDPASVRFFNYLGRRLHGLRVLLALAVRDTEPDAAEPLASLLADPSATVLRPTALSVIAVSALVRARLTPDADDTFCRACHVATGGNPFLVEELLTGLMARGASGTAGEVAQVAGMGPQSISQAVLLRLARLPAAATAVARAVAVLSAHAEYRHVMHLADLDDEETAATVTLLAQAGILEDARPLRFVHPIVRNAVYADLGPTLTSQHHRRAADMLLAEGAAPDEIAVHLMATDARGDHRVVEILKSAAGLAVKHSAPEAAANFLRRALAEPPPAEARAPVLAELGAAEFLAQDPRAGEHLSEALALAQDANLRATIAPGLANLLNILGDVRGAVAVLDDAIRGLGPEQQERALTLENDLIHVARLHPSTAAHAVSRTERLATDLRGRSDRLLTRAERLTLVNVAVEMTRAGGSADEAALMATRALRGGQLLEDSPPEQPPFGAAVLVLVYADRFEQAERMLHLGMDAARRRGSAPAFTIMSTFLALLACRRGDLVDAESDLAAAESVGASPPFVAPWIAKLHVDVLLDKGEAAEAERTLARYDVVGEVPEFYSFNALLEARGRLWIALGQPARAGEDLHHVGRRQAALGETNPSVLSWRSSAALAHAALGERDEAVRLADEEVALATAFGAPRAVGIALRVSGVVLGGSEGIEKLRAAVSILQRSQARLELARALTDLGSALRRAGRRSEARPPLRAGIDLALRCGASGLVERGREELTATGARPRRLVLLGPAALTPSERRVATMASSGMTNKQIAQALFVSTRTVEMHLSGAYRKLGIASREELAGALEGNPTMRRPVS